MTSSLRNRLVDGPESLGARARARRAERFLTLFPELGEMHVLDLGGTLDFWQRLRTTPKSVTALNTALPPQSSNLIPSWFTAHAGDACDPPLEVQIGRFDLVFSNSTLEHVGDEGRRQLFADTVHRLGARHWVQTPNRYFPIEPHVLFPFQQFLPRRGRGFVYRYWPLVHSRAKTMAGAMRTADNTELLTRADMRDLFPTSSIIEERVAPGLPAKSFIATRTLP